VLTHFPHPFFDDALHRSSPPGVKYADRPMFRINQDNWEAIRGEHCE